MTPQITPAQFAAWLAGAPSGAKPVLLDVREPMELEMAAVKPGAGYTLLTIPMNDVPQRLSEIPADQPVACLCHHGGRSQRVASFLEQSGYTQVVNIAGGIDAWAVERDPSVPRY